MSQPAQPGGQTAEQSGTRNVALAMFGLLLVTYTLMAADRRLVIMLGADIRGALNLGLPQMRALSAMLTLGIAVAAIPAGELIVRYSRKAVLIAGVVLFSSATLLFTQATGFYSMFIFVVMQGVGMAFLATSMLSLAASYFANSRIAAVGAVNVCFGLGALLGSWSIGNIRDAFGAWETPMLIFGACGIVLAILIALTVRSWFTEAAKGTGGAVSRRNRNTILLSIMSALYGMVIYGFLGTYPSYMREVLELTAADAGAVMLWFGVGGLTAFFGGKLGDHFSPQVVIGGSSLVLVVMSFFIYLPDLSLGMYKLMAFIVGVLGASIVYTNLAGCHIKSLRSDLSSRGSAIFLTTIFGGAAFGGFLIGPLIQMQGWAFAGQISMSLLSLIIALLTFGLRTDQMSN
jgi:DHA1 family inner membrane transport protein